MKTTKKGFTLIELIVVIAIIGVLAAILVPTMLGYVRKSKLSSANTTASSVYKAINSALTELDEEGIDIGEDLYIKYNGTAWSTEDTSGKLSGNLGATKKFDTKVANFFADITKVKEGVQAVTANGGCVAVAIASDSTYTGTYPSGVVTSDNYTTYKGSANLKSALQHAVIVAAGGKGDDDALPSGCNGSYTAAYAAIGE
ncbi:MAG: type II secretion system GspH family protein [Ruminococcus sp.]|nr:type II secretion system GspH family protein [Ruminococcus sp.]